MRKNCAHCTNGYCQLVKMRDKTVPCEKVSAELCQFMSIERLNLLKKWDEQLIRKVESEDRVWIKKEWTPNPFSLYSPRWFEREEQLKRGYNESTGSTHWDSYKGEYITYEESRYREERKRAESIRRWGEDDDEPVGWFR